MRCKIVNFVNLWKHFWRIVAEVATQSTCFAPRIGSWGLEQEEVTEEELYKSLNIHLIFEVENYVIVLPSSVRNPDSRRGKEVMTNPTSKTIFLPVDWSQMSPSQSCDKLVVDNRQNHSWEWYTFREDINEKKTFSFGHCLNYLNPPPPHDPNSGNLVLFFWTSKFRTWKSV